MFGGKGVVLVASVKSTKKGQVLVWLQAVAAVRWGKQTLPSSGWHSEEGIWEGEGS